MLTKIVRLLLFRSDDKQRANAGTPADSGSQRCNIRWPLSRQIMLIWIRARLQFLQRGRLSARYTASSVSINGPRETFDLQGFCLVVENQRRKRWIVISTCQAIGQYAEKLETDGSRTTNMRAGNTINQSPFVVCGAGLTRHQCGNFRRKN